MQSEVENALYDMLSGEGNEWGGSITDYLKEKGFECVTIMKSGGVNDGYPQFYDFEVDMGEKEIHAASELPIMQQAEQLINLMEFHRSVYSIDERNLIMNHAFKLMMPSSLGFCCLCSCPCLLPSGYLRRYLVYCL